MLQLQISTAPITEESTSISHLSFWTQQNLCQTDVSNHNSCNESYNSSSPRYRFRAIFLPKLPSEPYPRNFQFNSSITLGNRSVKISEITTKLAVQGEFSGVLGKEPEKG
ncbi:hypothetical protein JTE90_020852 [Oedothorax gibbosus]|uniref:Uncharacterized protein n=1 Tax=Oedothorax gibbosus TaxID=931172 RepID=A0AAV6US17_9ARAC|nr:hypothetical protein JTE90_020852 [Oedothorax gibbosus]